MIGLASSHPELEMGGSIPIWLVHIPCNPFPRPLSSVVQALRPDLPRLGSVFWNRFDFVLFSADDYLSFLHDIIFPLRADVSNLEDT